jgi:hypothetical protein
VSCFIDKPHTLLKHDLSHDDLEQSSTKRNDKLEPLGYDLHKLGFASPNFVSPHGAKHELKISKSLICTELV